MKSLTLHDLKRLEQMFADLQGDVTIVYFTEGVGCRHCRQERKLLAELVDLSHKLHLEVYNFTADCDEAREYGIDKVPGLMLVGRQDYGIRYYGMPSDFEFQMLLEDMIRVSSGESGLCPETICKIHKLRVPTHLEVLTTPDCPFSRGAVRLAHQMAMESDKISADLIHLDDFPDLVERYKVTAAPTVVVNGNRLFYGALPEGDFVEEVLGGARSNGDGSSHV